MDPYLIFSINFASQNNNTLWLLNPHFRTLLRENPCQHPIIILRETKSEDLTAILHFMYHGEVSIEEHRLESFLKSAAAFKVRGLTEGHEQQQQQQQQAAAEQQLHPGMTPNTTTTSSSSRKRKSDSSVQLAPMKLASLVDSPGAVVKHEILVTTTPSAAHPPGAFSQQQTQQQPLVQQQQQPQQSHHPAATFNLNMAYDQPGAAEAFVDDNNSKFLN